MLKNMSFELIKTQLSYFAKTFPQPITNSYVCGTHPPWRNWLARSTVTHSCEANREVDSSSLSGGVMQGSFLFARC